MNILHNGHTSEVPNRLEAVCTIQDAEIFQKDFKVILFTDKFILKHD